MKRRHPYKFTCYIPSEKEHTVKQFLEITDREGSSGAEKVLDFIIKYVDRHKHGNPQTMMERFSEKPKLTCFKCRKEFHFLNHVEFISGKTARICDECKANYEERRLVKKVLRKS